MKRFYAGLIGIGISCFNVSAFSQKPGGFDFVENKGQWADSVRYAAQLPGGMLHIANSGFAYYYALEADLRRINDKKEQGQMVDSEQVHIHNYRVSYVGGNDHISYTTADKRNNYINYFYGQDKAKWQGHIGLYGKVVQHNVYDGIDVAVYSKDKSLKYDFIVAPGSDPTLIKMKFEGVNPVLTAEGHLKITTSVNEITEQAPYAYQVINGVAVQVPCHYQLNNDQITFALPDGYNPGYALVIDPELVFTTFSGAGDFFSGYFSYCTTYDKQGSLYAAAVPSRFFWTPPPQWPTTPGAFQEAWTTIYEPMTCINKYTPDGSDLVFSTYFGGSGPNDLPHSMIVNDEHELILAGSTGSFNLPVTTGCFDSTKSGGTDIFIAHFNEDGSNLVGATYMGGNIGNSINAIDLFSTSGFSNQNKTSPIELALDDSGNIWVVSNTSTSDFPVSANAFQPTIGGGNADGVVFALNPECTELVYGSFVGGNHTDVVYGIQFNSSGNVVICGGTKSNNFPTTADAFKTTAPGSGDWDGFVAIVNPTSGALLSSTYLGTDQDDQATHVQVDVADNVYILGRTFGDYPIAPGVYDMPGTDLFIHKLSPSLSNSLSSTRLGNPQTSGTAFFPTAFLVDECTNTYITGLSGTYTVPLSNMPLSDDAFQTTPGNFWFGVLEPNFGGLLFGTYYGRVHGNGINGDHTHTGSNRLDPEGILYQSLCVSSNDYPGTSPDSWSEFNQNNVGQDIVSFKFAFNLAGVSSGFLLPEGQNNTGCAPFDVQFENTSTMAIDYVWDFGDGSPQSYEQNPSHTYTIPGTFTVALYAYNDTACIRADTSYATITVFDPQLPDISVTDTLICTEEGQVSLMVQLNNPSANNYFKWQPFTGILGPDDQQTVIVNPAVDTQFIVTVWDSIPGHCGFSSTDTLTIDYKPKLLNILTPDTLLCLGDSLSLEVTATTGYSFQWSPEENVHNPDQLQPLIIPEQTTTYTINASYPGCGDTSQTITIRVDEPAGISFTADPDQLCTGAPVIFTPTQDSTIVELYWDFGDGTVRTSDPMERSTRHAYDQAGMMQVNLTARPRVCPDTTYMLPIEVFPFPEVDLGSDSTICLDGAAVYLKNLRDAPGVAYRYLWNTGDTTPILQVVQPGTYSLQVITEPVECTTRDEVVVTKDCYTDIPNAFTPNGDGDNDYFFPRTLLSKSVSSFKMQIFNRWGQLVFETTRTDGRGWDGRFNDKDQPMGVYIYVVDVVYTNSRQERYEGNVTLVR